MTTIESRLAHLSDSKRALLAKMMRRDEPSSSAIAVVGMACRFPGGANDPESFWGLMRDGRDPVQEVPADRWDVERYYDPDPEAPGKICTRWAGMLDGIDQFDASLFGISQSEAEAMDPQQRILLEVAWEALESAGYAPLSLSGSRTGVYVGLFHASYGEGIVVRGPAAVDAHSVNGIMHCSAVGRLSFLLGLEGPCVPVNTACSSSLVAVHQACRALQSGEADMALAGGVNVLHSLHWLISLCKLHVISPDGRCRAFDASANGMVEAEGAGLLVLKRLQDAQAAGDRVLALVRGSAVNHNGRSASLTAPSGRAQRACIRAALKAAGVSPAEVSFLEAQGTATPLGDSIEVSAAAEVLNEGRRPEDRIWLTSVKANIGHAEAASGVAGLIKVILAMQHQAVPPQLHFRQLHPDISFGSTPFAIPTRMEPWPRSQRPRLAGVSGFGMSGTNAHVVLEEPPVPAREARAARPRHLLCLSAQTEPGLRAQVERYRAHLEGAEGEGLGDLAFTANAGRSHLRERLAVTAGSAAELGARLSAFLHGEPGAAALRGRANAGERVKVAFVFSGAEGLRPGLGKALYDSEPAFRRTVDACAEAVRGLTGASLVPAVFSEHPLALRRPALYALQCALCETWRSWGVVPEAVLGHGAGELAAACASGALSLEDGARLSADLEKALPAANFGSPAIPLFSSQSGGEVTATLADHLRGALREPQELQRSLQAVLGRGVKALLELGPHHAPSLLASVPADKAACIPSLLRGEDDWEVLLGAAGALYAHGAEVDFRAMDRPFGHRTAPAPTYAFQRRRYWLPPSPEARGGGAHPLLRTSIRTPRGDAYLEGELQGNDQRPWVEYRVRGALLLRAAAALQTMLSAAAAATSDERWALHGVKLEAPAAPGGGVRLQAMVGAESGEARRVELYARPASGGDAEPWAPVASAELRRAQAAAGPPAAEPKEGTEVVLDGAACHELLGKGDERAPGFRLLEEVRIRGRTAVGQVRASGWTGPSNASPAVWDACLQALAVLQQARRHGRPGEPRAYAPVSAERVWMAPSASGKLRCEATLREGSSDDEVVGDVRAVDLTGRVALEVLGLSLRSAAAARAEQAAARAAREDGGARALLERLGRVPAGDRLAELQRELRALMARVLELPALLGLGASRPLADAGVDAGELRGALGRFFSLSFSTTLLLDHPSLEALARHLAAEEPGLQALIGEPEAAPARPDPVAGLLERLAQLSDEEAAALSASLTAGSK